MLEEDEGVGLQSTTGMQNPQAGCEAAKSDACISPLILGAKCVRTAEGHLQVYRKGGIVLTNVRRYILFMTTLKLTSKSAAIWGHVAILTF